MVKEKRSGEHLNLGTYLKQDVIPVRIIQFEIEEMFLSQNLISQHFEFLCLIMLLYYSIHFCFKTILWVLKHINTWF